MLAYAFRHTLLAMYKWRPCCRLGFRFRGVFWGVVLMVIFRVSDLRKKIGGRQTVWESVHGHLLQWDRVTKGVGLRQPSGAFVALPAADTATEAKRRYVEFAEL